MLDKSTLYVEKFPMILLEYLFSAIFNLKHICLLYVNKSFKLYFKCICLDIGGTLHILLIEKQKQKMRPPP